MNMQKLTANQLELLGGSVWASQVLMRAAVKIENNRRAGLEKPVATFWKMGENWINQGSMVAALEELKAAGLVDFSVNELTIIVRMIKE